MAVARGQQAITQLRTLLAEGHSDTPADLVDYDPYGTEPPVGWLWSEGQPQPGLGSHESYDLSSVTVPLETLNGSPATVLDASAGEPFTSEQEEYCRRSIDATMKGGTTSAVIYPLALAELARHFRFRNVGGASAGAIAASLAVAAEHGRTRMAYADSVPADTRSDRDIAQGRLRQGFAGMADIIAWVTQLDRPDDPDEFRLSQLFKPVAGSERLFWVVAAAMRGRLVRGALLLLLGQPRRTLIPTLLVFLASPLGLAVTTAWNNPGALWWWYGWAFAVLWLGFGWLIPLVVLIGTKPKPAAAAAPGFEEPVQPVAAAPTASAPHGRRTMEVFAAACLVAWVVVTLVAFGWRLAPTLVYLFVGLIFLLGEIALVVVLFIAGLLVIGADAKTFGYGMIAGSGSTAGTGYRRYLATLVAGARIMPQPTVAANVVDWLTQAQADLSGIGTDGVLRFGHLWLGPDFVPGAGGEKAREASENPRARVINLELMSTELIRRAPYRFPLPASDAGERLYFVASDLEGVVPPRVIAAMTDGSTTISAKRSGGGEPVTLHPLPEPWDLPVVFATRCSLSLPLLFRAIRLYVLRDGSLPVRTEFGARLTSPGGVPLIYPGPESDHEPIAEELWLTDGGVTSNFPIHMFDSPLPLWPTVGIDLGDHPSGSAHQDVLLPGEVTGAIDFGKPLGAGMASFLGAILGTSLGWRDSAQLLMPAFRSRIAVVRQRPSEGGNNLFMARADIASLAIRGAVAGARLRRRFAADGQWRRHQWLRVRVTAQSLAGLSGRLRSSLGDTEYLRLMASPTSPTELAKPGVIPELIEALANQADPHPATSEPDGADPALDWYEPSADFFGSLHRLLVAHRDTSVALASLEDGAPRPFSELRQSPRA